MDDVDVVVAGLGVAGSAAARELALRGHRVLGLDRHAEGHDRGGSHGESRLIRRVYYEGPHYVPLLGRAFRAWRELEERSGRELLLRTGGLTVGPPDGELAAGSRRAVREHG
ncbi:MAG: FAD-dependent oxidoreductase, partial [Gemmatimonadota bacterium]